MSVLLKRMEQEGTMVERIISPGDKVELKSTDVVQLPDGTEGTKLYQSLVYDVLEDGRLEIVMPMEQTKMVLLPIDGEYEACFFSNGAMYRAIIRIVDRQKNENTYILVTELITDLARFQRREYYRFNCVIEMNLKEITLNEAQTIGKNLSHLVSDEEMQKGVIVDISGGGLRFLSSKPMKQGSLLYLKFKLPIAGEQKEFTLASKLVTTKVLEKSQDEYENRVKFLFIDNTTREEIIKYIFDEDRKNRKNGKR